MYTIKQIERALGVLNINEVSPGKDTDNGDFIEKLNNRLEIDLAIKKLPIQEQEILQMILGGFSYREIKCELKVGSDKISGSLKALCDTIK
jgi:DNA-directed RNA polymerase specialized sigma24 family protein